MTNPRIKQQPNPLPRLAPQEGGLSGRAQALLDKLDQLVKRRFGGDYKKALAHYDRDKNGLDAKELERAFEDAGIGNFLSRSLYVKGTLQKVDQNKDGRLQWKELSAFVKQAR